ncbi:alpha/beta hydrolase [Swingsia samuiensis]|uniref:Alpha/beta hydrolase n=1 Tax=Swingsia samuiensis TaxID=1293412 RepID=A0A4Y6UKL4_9PROT|nr:alpha/beta hydrolase [Swingsia samuiensis]QDH17188.1 alpha/beta hydrolase [Swingsia samuiensis]
MKSVQIQNSDMPWSIAANILFPPGFDESRTYPTIVSVHPFGSCKEQTSGNVYGNALAKEGFVVITYDASYQGESGGAPRWIESPSQRVEDISHVIDYAVTLSYVDADRIGVIGVCAGGGYVINAALTEKRIKAVAAITPINLGRLFREGFSEFNPLGTLEAMSTQRTKEARGEELQVNELLPQNIETARTNGLTDRDVLEATDYYKTPRGQKPGGWTRMLFSHAQKILSWDAFAFAETLLTQPVMVVVGEKIGAFGAYRDGIEVYSRATTSKDRQIVSLENSSHYDLYDKPEAVELALNKIFPFFKMHLGKNASIQNESDYTNIK